jgi:hypothetical protein
MIDNIILILDDRPIKLDILEYDIDIKLSPNHWSHTGFSLIYYLELSIKGLIHLSNRGLYDFIIKEKDLIFEYSQGRLISTSITVSNIMLTKIMFLNSKNYEVNSKEAMALKEIIFEKGIKGNLIL